MTPGYEMIMKIMITAVMMMIIVMVKGIVMVMMMVKMTVIMMTMILKVCRHIPSKVWRVQGRWFLPGRSPPPRLHSTNETVGT